MLRNTKLFVYHFRKLNPDAKVLLVKWQNSVAFVKSLKEVAVSSTYKSDRNWRSNFSVFSTKCFSTWALIVKFNKKGLHVKPNITRSKRNILTASELLMSSHHKDRRRFLWILAMLICKNTCCISATIAVSPIRNWRRISWARGRRHGLLYDIPFKDGCLGDLADMSKTTRILVVSLSLLITALCSK